MRRPSPVPVPSTAPPSGEEWPASLVLSPRAWGWGSLLSSVEPDQSSVPCPAVPPPPTRRHRGVAGLVSRVDLCSQTCLGGSAGLALMPPRATGATAAPPHRSGQCIQKGGRSPAKETQPSPGLRDPPSRPRLLWASSAHSGCVPRLHPRALQRRLRPRAGRGRDTRPWVQ